MRNAGLTPGKTQNSVNQPLLDPAGQKREFKKPPSSPTRASIKEKLMIQAGILNAETHNEDHHPLYRYHFDGTERSAPPEWRCCCGLCRHQPNFHSSLFWGGNVGVDFFYGYIRTQMVLCALYLGTFCVIFAPVVFTFFKEYAEKHEVHRVATWGPLSVIFIALFPLAFMLYELGELIPILIRITTTEEMIDDEAVNGVLRIMKSRRALRALHNISCFMASVDKVADQCRAKALQSSTFGMLTEDEREALMADCEMHTYTPNKVIIQQGSVNKSLYIISLGKATVEIDGNIGTSNTACVGCVFVNLIVLHSVCLLYSCFNLDTWYDVFYSFVVATLDAGKEFGEISMLKGAPTNASIIAVGKPHTICFKLGKDTFEKHLRGKNKQREAMIEVSHAEKLQKIQTSNSTTGLMTNAGRRSSIKRLETHKRKASGDTKINLEAEKEQDLANTGRDWVGSGTMVDTTGDGKVDTMAFDTTNDGRIDAYLIDTTGDGNKNALGFDTTGDGHIDMVDEGKRPECIVCCYQWRHWMN